MGQTQHPRGRPHLSPPLLIWNRRRILVAASGAVDQIENAVHLVEGGDQPPFYGGGTDAQPPCDLQVVHRLEPAEQENVSFHPGQTLKRIAVGLTRIVGIETRSAPEPPVAQTPPLR